VGNLTQLSDRYSMQPCMDGQNDAMRPQNPGALRRDVNLGCGRRRREACLNVDRAAQVAPDLVWDLDQYPYPLPESRFRRIRDLWTRLVLEGRRRVEQRFAWSGVVEHCLRAYAIRCRRREGAGR